MSGEAGEVHYCDTDWEPSSKPRLPPPPAGRAVDRSASAKAISIEYPITSWHDPLTAPQTRTRCVQEASGHWPWSEDWSACTGWATDCRFMRNEAVFILEADFTEQDARDASKRCMEKAAVAAAFTAVAAAYVTGGAGLGAAQEAFKDVYLACMVGELGDRVSVRFPDVRSGWTDWGSCGR